MNRILIVSPSLDPNENVSGISSLMVSIISNSSQPIDNFVLGSKDGVQKGVIWFFKQFSNLFDYILLLINKAYQVVHLNTSFMPLSIYRDVVYSFITKKVLKRRLILHAHGGYFLMNSPKSYIFRGIIKIFLGHADVIIVLTESEKGKLTELYGTGDYRVYPNAVDVGFLDKQIDGQKPAGKIFKLIFLGKITVNKGIYVITESMRFLKEYFDFFELDIYGAGPELDNWLMELEKIKGLNFKYKGVVSGQDKWKALLEADIFLLPSAYEGLSIAMLEAMAAGCAVIVSDDTSITNVVTDGKNGFVVSKNAPEQLALKCKNIFEKAVDLDGITNNAINDVKRSFSFSSYIDRLDNLYKQMT